jgi:general secretion pathway protein G
MAMSATGNRNRAPGSTLIELLVGLVIASVMLGAAVMAFPRTDERRAEQAAVRAAQDVAAIVSALNMYRLDNYAYPSSEQGLMALVTKPLDAQGWRAGGYLANLPKDPWNHDYEYLNPGQHGEVDVWTLGADGKPGGEGINGDVGNWQP